MALASLCSSMRDWGPLTEREGNGDKRKRPRFTAFIVDHQLRSHSTSEACRVSSKLSRLDISSQVLELDWKPYGDPHKLPNLESTARRLRYQATGRACREQGINTLLFGHHQDDQAETVLMRMLANYSGAGLRGIKSEAAIPECAGLYGVDHSGDCEAADEESRLLSRELEGGMRFESGGVSIARPLLAFDKEQLIAICKQDGVGWFEDHTNAVVTLTVRNTIRSLLNSDVLPEALQKNSLLAVAAMKARESEEAETAAAKALEQMPISLDVRSGSATLTVPKERTLAVSGTARAMLLRKMIGMVAPAGNLSLQDLYAATEYVLGLDENGADTNVSTIVQVAGVSIARVLDDADSDFGNCVFQFSRSMPTQKEKTISQIALWSSHQSGQSGDGHDLKQWTHWQLWDGRYWLRVCLPKGTGTWNVQIIVRFLVKDDIRKLRRSLDKEEAERLQQALDLAKGSLRFTCPALVMIERPDDGDAIERVVALPSLGWSCKSWDRHQGPDLPNRRSWDIRYKHVELEHTVSA